MVAQCLQDDVSLAALAVEHGMNPNVLHRWVKEVRARGTHIDDGRMCGRQCLILGLTALTTQFEAATDVATVRRSCYSDA